MTEAVKVELLTLPDILPGHWETASGREMAQRYASKPRPHALLTDMEIANQLFLQNGDIVSQTDAKERIRWLSVHLALANQELTRLASLAREPQPVANDRLELPWRISTFESGSGGFNRCIMGADDFAICYISGRSQGEHEAIADFIVAASQAALATPSPRADDEYVPDEVDGYLAIDHGPDYFRSTPPRADREAIAREALEPQRFVATVGIRRQEHVIESLAELLRLINGGATFGNIRLAKADAILKLSGERE
jgi:hypothetical protein